MYSEYLKYIPTSDAVLIVKNTLKLIDPRLVDHGERVAYLLLKFLEDLDYSETEKKYMFLLGVFHDIGAYKTEEIDKMVHFETDDVKNHSIYGYLFLKYFTPLQNHADVILYHHSPFSQMTDRKDELDIRAANLLHLADRIDLLAHSYSDEKLYDFLRDRKETIFSPFQVERFIELNEEHHLTDEIRDNSFQTYIDDYLQRMSLSQFEIESFIKMVVYTIDFRSEFTVTHSITTQSFSIELASLLNLDEPHLAKVYYGSFLHDIGKITTPLNILESPNRLTFEEMEIMKEHATWTKKILSGIVDTEVKEIAAHHHEKLDGTGYPDKLTENELSLPEKIVAVADIISALTGVRSYKKAFPKERIIEILEKERDGGKLDKTVCDLAINSYDKIVEVALRRSQELLNKYEAMQTEYSELYKKIV